MRRTKREELVRAFLINEGFEPNERQLAWAVAFCTPGRCFRDSVKAARVAGYPNPEEGGDYCYGEMGDILQKLLHEQDTMSLAVWQTVSEQLQATTTKIISHQGLVMDMISMADNGARISAARLAAEMLGMKAPERMSLEGGDKPIQHSHTVSAELLEDKIKSLLGDDKQVDFL